MIIHTHTKKPHNVLSKFTILCWAAFTTILGCMQPVGHRLDTAVCDDIPDGFLQGNPYLFLFVYLILQDMCFKT